jgi:hypothetical protein
MQLVVTAEADTAQALDGFSDLIGKRALRRRRKSLEKKAEEEVDDKATGVGSRRDAANTVEETGETAQEGDTPAAPPRGPAVQGRGRRHQKRATWAEVVAAGGVNIPAVFGLLGLNIGKGKGVRRPRNRRPRTPQKGGTAGGGSKEGSGGKKDH